MRPSHLFAAVPAIVVPGRLLTPFLAPAIMPTIMPTIMPAVIPSVLADVTDWRVQRNPNPGRHLLSPLHVALRDAIAEQAGGLVRADWEDLQGGGLLQEGDDRKAAALLRDRVQREGEVADSAAVVVEVLPDVAWGDGGQPIELPCANTAGAESLPSERCGERLVTKSLCAAVYVVAEAGVVRGVDSFSSLKFRRICACRCGGRCITSSCRRFFICCIWLWYDAAGLPIAFPLRRCWCRP